MSRKSHSLSRHFLLATALAFSASSLALADDNSMNPSVPASNNSQNRGDPNVTAQSGESIRAPEKKVAQQSDSKTRRPADRAPDASPVTLNRSPWVATFYNQFPGE
jgi:hypothetical protein